MPVPVRRFILMLLAVACVAGSPLTGRCGELMRAIRRSHASAYAPAPYAGNPRQVAPHSVVFPRTDAWRHPAEVGGASLSGVQAGAVPTFAWGYFGVRQKSYSYSHRGYYGNFYQFHVREGY
jgi:hypothetical protein